MNWINTIKNNGFKETIFVIFLSGIFFTTDTFLKVSYLPSQINPTLIFQFVIYATIYGLSIYSLAIALFNSSWWVRTVSEIFLFSSMFMEILYLLVAGRRFLYFDAINLVNNLHYTESAVQNFYIQFLLSFFITCIGYYLVSKSIRSVPRTYAAKYFWLVLISFIIIRIQMLHSNDSLDRFPILYRAPVAFFLAINEKKDVIKRSSVKVQPVTAGVKHVFLVVDESISATHLSLNGADSSLTPFMWHHKEKIKNFGIACAFTNHSAGSNVALYSGARMTDLPDVSKAILKKPNIFQFAKHAGYITYYMDAQTEEKKTQNFMTEEDLKYVDVFLQPPSNTPAFLRDHYMADILNKLLKTDKKIFVYFNKYGAHWPYNKSYPNVTQQTFTTIPTAPNEILKQYHTALKWTVDEFWKKILYNLDSCKNAAMIYTSDHGQNFTSTLMRHGSLENATAEEAAVPLWVFDKSVYATTYSPLDHSQYSHENIFPTILRYFGYSEAFTKNNYPPSLMYKPDSNKRYFLSGDVFGRSIHKKNGFDIP